MDMTKPDRGDFDNRPDYKRANRDFVAKLLKLKPDDSPLESVQATLEAQAEAIKVLTKQVIDLNDILMRTDTVFVEDRGTFDISSSDHLRIALAAMMASRGIAVDLPLSNGEVIENVRIGELVKIATQIFEGHEIEGGDDEPATG
ncbi:MAG: hypothetical protein AAGK93_04105 [Pseudomonadota bacterium]